MNNVAKMIAMAVLAMATGLAGADPGRSESGKGKGKHKGKAHDVPMIVGERPVGHPKRGKRNDRGRAAPASSWFHDHGYSRRDIPPGHYPPPGLCRVWHPARPPGHQPPPGDCLRLQYEAPAGAWLIGHPTDRRGHVHVSVYDAPAPLSGWRRPVVIGEFDTTSGVLGRVLADEDLFFYRD
jgi:hypothetical protein